MQGASTAPVDLRHGTINIMRYQKVGSSGIVSATKQHFCWRNIHLKWVHWHYFAFKCCGSKAHFVNSAAFNVSEVRLQQQQQQNPRHIVSEILRVIFNSIQLQQKGYQHRSVTFF